MIVHNALRGILLMVGAMVSLPTKDGMWKILRGTYPALEILWARFGIVI